MEEKLDKMIEDLGADGYQIGEWKGYKVYIPVYTREVTIGLPIVVLQKGDELRYSDKDESIDIINAFYGDED